MKLFPVLLLAFAVSIDSFSVGFTYGVRKVRIPLVSIFIIAFCSGLALYLASIAGLYVGYFLSPQISETIGGVILVILGVWALFQFFKTSKEDGQSSDNERLKNEKKELLKFELKAFGVVIHILKTPMSADLDKSGTITGYEAVLLGAALALDAAGAGISASMLGYSPVFLAVAVGAMSACFASIGIKMGTSLLKFKWVQKFSFLPGILLICIGLWQM